MNARSSAHETLNKPDHRPAASLCLALLLASVSPAQAPASAPLRIASTTPIPIKITPHIKIQPATVGGSPNSRASLRALLVSQLKISAVVQAVKLVNLVSLRLLDSGDSSRCNDVELLARHTLSFSEILANALQSEGPVARTHGQSVVDIAFCKSLRGDYGSAEALYRQAIVAQEGLHRPDEVAEATLVTSEALTRFAVLLDAEGRISEAEPLYRRALATAEHAQGPDGNSVATSALNLAVFLTQQRRYAVAEPLFQRALGIAEKIHGAQSAAVATVLNDYATLLLAQRRYPDAEANYRRALAIDEQTVGPERAASATSLSNLAYCLFLQQRYAEAEPLFAQALAIREKVLRPNHPDTVGLRENIALNYAGEARYENAVRNYRLACAARFSFGTGHDIHGDAAQAARLAANNCALNYTLALAAWAGLGGGSAPQDKAAALMGEAFDASQRATRSATSDAIAQSAAFTAAQSAGVGTEAEDYETALHERDEDDLEFAKNVGAGIVADDDALAAHDAAAGKIQQLERDIKTKAPLYWEYRSAEPVSIAALQAKTGADAALLRPEEALITFLVSPGESAGVVFAVSKDKVAWARMGCSGACVTQRVSDLRAELDPDSYELAADAANAAPADPAPHPRRFDRQAAYALHQVLLGDPGIQAVIKDKPVLLFVAHGPLTSLPPGILITQAPLGDAAQDASADTLRKTAWLLRTKAVAMLPGVSSLRTLRQIFPDRPAASDLLLAFADPEFSHRAKAAQLSDSSVGERGVPMHFRGGEPMRQVLEELPRLPGSRVEGEALARALGAGPESLLMGADASKAELMARNEDGRLAKVRTLEFATHALISGDVLGLTEPALVLAAGRKPEDALLLASEAATLKLNADWVLLSACNTASPSGPGAEGFTGLTRAFLYAGAKSLLVSHWSVRDDVAPRLIPAMLLAAQGHGSLGRAQALRQASLAVLDDPDLDAADPAAWAPFTLVGEAAR